MKKYLLLMLFLVCVCMFLLPKKQRHQSSCDELYKVMCNENLDAFDKEKILNINVGFDYIPYELIELFEELTGIRVITDIFDSNEMLEAKLLAGSIQYDIVFPTAWPNFSRQLKAGIYKKIDKSKIDYEKFDADILNRLTKCNGEIEYCIPYQFGISGIGINKKVIDKLIPNAPKDSLAIIFDPQYISKLSKYRISIYGSPDELFPAVFAFLGLDPEADDEQSIVAASEHLKKIRKYISKFTSNGFEDLASGNACVTLGTSGDILNAKHINKNDDIVFIFPKEGAPLWVDVVAIPTDAKHVKNAYAFIKFLFHPMVIAYVTNKTSRANAVTASSTFVKKEILNDENIYPPINMRKECYVEVPMSSKSEALKNRLLTRIKSMDN